MGYSDSMETVENRRDKLGELMEGKPTVWECQPGTEKTIAYQVRECLSIGERNPDIYPGLAKAAREFSVVIQGRGSVATRPKRFMNASPVTIKEDSLSPQKKEPAPEEKELAYGGGQTTNSIVQRWIDSTGNQTLHFPEAALPIDELKKLARWAEEQKVLLFFKDPMVTLKPFDEELAAFAFDPEEDLP